MRRNVLAFLNVSTESTSWLGALAFLFVFLTLAAHQWLQIEAAVEAGVEIPTVPITTSQLVQMGENQAATAMECAQPYSTVRVRQDDAQQVQ